MIIVYGRTALCREGRDYDAQKSRQAAWRPTRCRRISAADAAGNRYVRRKLGKYGISLADTGTDRAERIIVIWLVRKYDNPMYKITWILVIVLLPLFGRLVLSVLGAIRRSIGRVPNISTSRNRRFHRLYAYTCYKGADRAASASCSTRPLHRDAGRYAGVDQHGDEIFPCRRGNV